MQGWHYDKGLIYYRPIFRLTKLAISQLSYLDLEQVLIHFISETTAQLLRLWSVGCKQRPEGDRCLEKHLHSKHRKLIKGCLEAPYLLTARVFSIYLPHFQGVEKWNVFLLEQHAFYFIIQLQCLIYYNRWHETKQMAGMAIFFTQSILHLDD